MFSCMHIPHGGLFHTKKPISPQSRGYTLEKEPHLEAGVWHVWRVNNHTNTSRFLDRLGIDPVGNRICIFDANTKSDKFPPDKKMRLRELMMGIWANEHNKEPKELQKVLIRDIVDEDIQKIWDKTYDIMKESDKSKPLTVHCDEASGEEKKAYHLLTNDFVFGHGVRHMLEEYSGLKGKKIKEFVLVRPPYQGIQFEIVIG